MAIKNQRGWIATQFTIFLFLLVTLLASVFAFQLQLRQEMKNDKICRYEIQDLMNSTRNSLNLVLSFNSVADFLHDFQIALKPLLWIPHMAALYAKIQNLRRALDKSQKALIKFLNLRLQQQSLNLYFKLKKDLTENQKTFQVYQNYHFSILPTKFYKMAIRKTRDDWFPSYKLQESFTDKQALKIPIFIQSKAYSQNLISHSYNENKACHASLKASQDMEFKIIYFSKSRFPLSLW